MPPSKRPDFTFPELERRGRRAFLRPQAEVAAEMKALERQTQAQAAAEERVKVTYRFSPEAVEDIRRVLRRSHGVRKVNRERIAEIAVLEAPRELERSGANSPPAKRFTE